MNVEAIIKALLTGMIFGGLCRWVDIPIPAPQQFEGIIAIAGLLLGWVIIGRFNL